MDKYDFSHVPELTEEEKQDPYAKFYSIPVKEPAPYLLEATAPGHYMDPANVLLPPDLYKLFAPRVFTGRKRLCGFAKRPGLYSHQHKAPWCDARDGGVLEPVVPV